MPERFYYAHLFKKNPLAHLQPEEAFSLLNWGNKHKATIEIDAPEPLIMLGMSKEIFLNDRRLIFRRGESFLAVGHKSNELYFIPRINNAPRAVVPAFSRADCQRVGLVRQTDYWSAKGRVKEVHYYHEHEEPFPALWIHKPSGIGYLRAASHNGKPSYAVGKEGIVG